MKMLKILVIFAVLGYFSWPSIQSDLEMYIVQVKSPKSQISVQSSRTELESWYSSFLPKTIATAGSDEKPRLIYSYHNVMKGFAARLSAEEVKEMEKKKGFISARPQMILPLHTTHTPNFLGLQQNMGLWRDSSYGKGVIIGVLDTGISPDHPSFSDKGMPPPPAKWKGGCDWNFFTKCNNKLIGVRTFLENGNSPLDDNGHLLMMGSISYPFPSVDVVSHSIYNDVVALGALTATQRGILVSCSAGNTGPHDSTLSNEALWILTVGASTLDRILKATVGNHKVFEGESVFHPKGHNPSYFPLFDPALNAADLDSRYCRTGTLNGRDIEGKLVLCMDGGCYSRIGKGQAVKDAGGVGMIIYNGPNGGFTKLADDHVLPALFITYQDGMNILAYMNSTSEPIARISFHGTIIGDKDAPVVASFSSRGPNLASPGILKPDIIGPGVNILAAWPTSTHTKSTFNIISGTSMSCPHLRHVNPSRANDPGLVYDTPFDDHLPYLCCLNYTNGQITDLLQHRVDCQTVRSISEAQLNYPSFSIKLGTSAQTYKRTVTNIGVAKSSYTVEIGPLLGVSVIVTPSTLNFSKLNQKLEYQVTFSIRANSSNNGVVQGFLKWTNNNHSVRSPIAIVVDTARLDF
uniref:Serine protease n=1 Tax=Solanum tuberosum TaxID=4113 RepID=M1AXJ7_SOLTU